jgi:RNA polymerase sigma-70 factor (ECF subfamily)
MIALAEWAAESHPAAGNKLHEHVTQAYLEWREDVYRYLLTLGLHPPQAQEAAQEVFMRLYVTLVKKEEAIRNQRAWVFRVAHNLGLTIRSKESATVPFEPELEATLPDRHGGAEGNLMERERLLRMHRAVKSLSPQQRQCLHLRAEGLRYREIADATGVTISTVAEFLRRAVARLKRAVYE